MHLNHLNWLSGSKIQKKNIQGTKVRCPKLLELKNKKKSHIWTPGVNLYLLNPYLAPNDYKSGTEPLNLKFLAKNHYFPSSYAHISHQKHRGWVKNPAEIIILNILQHRILL